MPRVTQSGIMVAASMLIATVTGCGPPPGGVSSRPTGSGNERTGCEVKARLSTPFEEKLHCNIVTINTLESGGKKVMYCWTDGVSCRRPNFPIDLYIDTNDAIDWAEPTAQCVVSIEARSATREIKVAHAITRGKLHSRSAGRGLLAFENVFRIDPAYHVIHESGDHRMAIVVEAGPEKYTGSCTFSIE